MAALGQKADRIVVNTYNDYDDRKKQNTWIEFFFFLPY